MRKAIWLLMVCALLVVLIYAPEALAQDQTQPRFDGILNSFRDQSIRWQGVLAASARWLFFTLAISWFAWSNMRLALKGGDLSDFIATNTQQILSIGIMYVFLVHSFDWSHALVKGFLQAGERAVLASAGAGAGAIDPANIFQNGLLVAASLFGQMSIWSGVDAIGLVICALVLICCFAFLAAFMSVVIVESYIIIGGSVLLLAFGGSGWTMDIARKTIMYAVSVGAKLFVLQLIVGVAMGSVIQWAQTYQQDSSTSTLSLIGLVILITVCAKMIPELVQGILSGVSVGGTSAMVGTIAAAAAAAAAGGAAVASGGAALGAAGGAASGAAGGAGAGAAGAAGGAAGGVQSASSGLFAQSGAHLMKMSGAIVDTATGLNPSAAMGPLSAVGHAFLGDPEKPSPPAAPAPGQGGASSAAVGEQGTAAAATPSGEGSSAADGGTIRGAGPGSGSPSTSSVHGTAAGAVERRNDTSAGSAGAASNSQAGANTQGRASQAAPGASSSSGETSTRSLDDRASQSRSPSGSDAPNGAALASDQLAARPGTDAPAGRPSGTGGDAQSLDQRADGTSGAGDAAESLSDSSTSAPIADPSGGHTDPTESVGADAVRRNATLGAAVGFVAAGPAGAVAGGAAAAALSPQIEAARRRAKTALDAAKARFGLTQSDGASRRD